MKFSHCTPADLDAAIDAANTAHGYALHAEIASVTNKAGTSFNARIVPDSSRVHGARRSAPTPWNNGRAVKAACWHAHRDVLAALFDIAPEARVQSAFADYRGKADFREKFPLTAAPNVGSQIMPVRICDLCECHR